MESIQPMRTRTAHNIKQHIDRDLEPRVLDDICGAKWGIPADLALQAVKA